MFLKSRVFKKVDLPAPLAPMMASTSPGLATPLTFCRICFAGLGSDFSKPKHHLPSWGEVDTFRLAQVKVMPSSMFSITGTPVCLHIRIVRVLNLL